MEAQLAVDLCRNAIWVALMVAGPTLLAGAAIGLLIGLFQALTQIQEQTIALVLKILVMVLVVAYLLPWMTVKLIDFSSELVASIPERML